MSKYVKNLVAEDIARPSSQGRPTTRLLVNMVGLDANANWRLRTELRRKNIHVLVVKNSLAARAMAGTPLARMFDGVSGSAAVCWGSEDIVSLAKEITRLVRSDISSRSRPAAASWTASTLGPQVARREPNGPPHRTIEHACRARSSGPAQWSSQLTAVSGALASQIEQKRADGREAEAEAPAGRGSRTGSRQARPLPRKKGNVCDPPSYSLSADDRLKDRPVAPSEKGPICDGDS